MKHAGMKHTAPLPEPTSGSPARTVFAAIKHALFPVVLLGALLGLVRPASGGTANDDSASDEKTVAALDTSYQAAVKANDAGTMDRILADDFILVLGTGKTETKADLLQEARRGRMHYEHQEDTNQTVHVWGDTAVVTAKLWAKGTDDGRPFELFVWFSDTYVRTPSGWRYVHGQASLPLPNQTK